MLHMFREFGNSVLIMSEVEPISRAMMNHAELVLRLEEQIEFRLIVVKSRYQPINESSLIAFFKEDFPSITIERHLYPDAPYLEGEVNDYLVFKDDTEALHFKLKYC